MPRGSFVFGHMVFAKIGSGWQNVVMIKLDHIAIAGETRDEAASHVTDVLGVALQPGGAHAHFGTHNHLMGLADGVYLEAISIDPAAPAPSYPRWFDMDSFSGAPRLTNWICQTPDIEALVQDLPEAGDIVSLERGDLKWRMAVPADGKLPFDGCFPALIQWDCEDHPAELLPHTGCRLDQLLVTHPDVMRLQQRLAPYLDDSRVHFETGSAGLAARIDCPNGLVWLR